jgi:hypothetical protein
VPAEVVSSPFVPVEGHPGFYYKAVHVVEATPKPYVQGAEPAETNSPLSSPALIPANSPTIVAAKPCLLRTYSMMAWKLKVAFTSNQAQRIGKTRQDWTVWVPLVVTDNGT